MANLPFSKVRSSGSTVYLSGEIGFDADGSVPEGIEAQTKNCLESIKKTLESEGLSLTNVVSCTCYLTDKADFAALQRCLCNLFFRSASGPHHHRLRPDDRRESGNYRHC